MLAVAFHMIGTNPPGKFARTASKSGSSLAGLIGIIGVVLLKRWKAKVWLIEPSIFPAFGS